MQLCWSRTQQVHPSFISHVSSERSPSPSSSFNTRVSLPKDAPVIPGPPIAYPSSLPDTPEASHQHRRHHLNVTSHVLHNFTGPGPQFHSSFTTRVSSERRPSPIYTLLHHSRRASKSHSHHSNPTGRIPFSLPDTTKTSHSASTP